MHTALLTAVLVWPVAFPGGPVVRLSLPDPGPADIYTASDPSTLFNPQRTAAVVGRCVSAAVNAKWCDLYLVQPRTGARPLPQGHLRGTPAVTWTPDGRFVVASGERWLRLWNLAGAVRGLSLADQTTATGQLISTELRRLTFRQRLLCLTLTSTVRTPVFAAPGPGQDGPAREGPAARGSITRQADHWPTLHRATPAEDRGCLSS
jgi:hypothetical protein